MRIELLVSGSNSNEGGSEALRPTSRSHHPGGKKIHPPLLSVPEVVTRSRPGTASRPRGFSEASQSNQEIHITNTNVPKHINKHSNKPTHTKTYQNKRTQNKPNQHSNKNKNERKKKYTKQTQNL